MLRAPEGDVLASGLSFQQLLGKLAVEDSHLVGVGTAAASCACEKGVRWPHGESEGMCRCCSALECSGNNAPSKGAGCNLSPEGRKVGS